MMFIRKSCLAICAAAFFAGGFSYADSLPLAPELVSLSSQAGEALLLKSEARRPFLPLSIHFLTQKNQAYCGVASMAMVLNALNIPAPPTPDFAPFRLFTQENVLNEATDRIIPQALIAKQGLTLDQLGAILSSHGVNVAVRHASDLSLEDFRREAIAYLSKPDHHVLVNYLRKQIGQERGGHISPLAAYDAETDRFLIMDVSRYKYPPVWVKSEQLFSAMNTPDADNQNRSRGFVLVSTHPKSSSQEK